MYKLLIAFSFLFLTQSHPKKVYIIVAGDISCKACVIELYTYLSKKTKKENLSVALRDKGLLVLNESSLNYYKKEVPGAKFQFIHDKYFSVKKEKYPYVLRIIRRDTLKIPYDSLYPNDRLNVKFLD